MLHNGGRAADVDVSTWRLRVEGDAVERPLDITYEDIRAMPSRSLVCYLECAGNHRAMFDLLKGRPAGSPPWGTGAVGNAKWTGVPLRNVLAEAGIVDKAMTVLLVGLDTTAPEGGYRRAMPGHKAMHPDTLLAYEMNGEVLPRDHGFPVRAVVPGWVGANSIKWLGRVVVSAEQIWTRNNTTNYVLIGEDYPTEGPAQGQPITTLVINSALALPWPAELNAGPQRIRGYARSPHGAITAVEWSADSGATWSSAEVEPSPSRYSWSPFTFRWVAEPGEHTLMTRAFDAAGNTQPDSQSRSTRGVTCSISHSRIRSGLPERTGRFAEHVRRLSPSLAGVVRVDAHVGALENGGVVDEHVRTLTQDDLAADEHDDHIGDAERDRRELLDEEHGRPRLRRLLDHPRQAFHDERGETEGDLVDQQTRRSGDERPGQHEHLLLAAGEFAGPDAGPFGQFGE